MVSSCMLIIEFYCVVSVTVGGPECLDGGQDIDAMAVYFTEEQPPKSIIGTGRHFFAKPSSKGFKLSGSVFKEDQPFI